MKSLGLTRPLVIMIIGLPGSGKSFFARQFADMFGAPLVSIDFVRHTVFPNATHSQDEDAVIGALAQNEIGELLKTGKTFVIDGGVNSRAGRLAIERQAVKNGYGKLCIWVQTDEQASLARSLKRSPKRSHDSLNVPLNAKVFERYKRQFNQPQSSEHTIVISGKHTFTTQARVVLKKLVAPREAQPVGLTVIERDNEPTDKAQDANPRRRIVPIN